MRPKEIFSKIRNFLKETQLETKKVVWPDRRYVALATTIIFVIVLLVSLLVMFLDLTFSRVYTYLVGITH